MKRCLVLYDVQSQSQHSARQRREQLMNEHENDEEGDDDSDSESGDVPPQISVMQEEEALDVGVIYKDLREAHDLQQLRPGGFDQDDYDEFKKAEAIFTAVDLPKNTRFYWAWVNALKEFVFWRKYFIDIVGRNDKDKVQLLEAMTGVSRNNQDVPKQLDSCHSFGSPHLGGLSSNIPSSVVGNPTKCIKMGNTTKCSSMGSTTKCTTVGHTIKHTTMATNSTRRFIRNNSNKCSIRFFTWLPK
ncbi:hypothetical protein CARUB_v10019261mg [Capsella rubella]|uniref:Uncharacterized protein n=1 Tax=Capsella rubella TaxID=81985 RepID=R0HKW2_9BRAS|nr:hypothetical protein CARUB_v10019261mg [Capsella rubella]